MDDAVFGSSVTGSIDHREAALDRHEANNSKHRSNVTRHGWLSEESSMAPSKRRPGPDVSQDLW